MKQIFGLLLFCGGLWAQQYVISTFAGGAPPPSGLAATSVNVGTPTDLALDANGGVYFASLNCVFRVDTKGILTRLAGTGVAGYSGDGGPGASARLSGALGVAVDAAGNVYIADTGNARIRRVAPSGVIVTIAGTGVEGYNGDGQPATAAQLNKPNSVAVDSAGNLYIQESGRIRKVAVSGMISTVAGNGTEGFSGDGGPATSAQIRSYRGLAVDADGNLYFSDTLSQRVRKISTTGTITTAAGKYALIAGEIPPSTGDGGPATEAWLNLPYDVAVDRTGRIYIATGNGVRVISTDGIINNVDLSAGAFTFGTQAVTVNDAGDIYVSDVNLVIRKRSAAGVVTTVAGPKNTFTVPSNLKPTDVRFNNPSGVATDSEGNVLIGDTENALVWRVGNGTIDSVKLGGKPVAVATDKADNYYALTPVIYRMHFPALPGEPAAVASAATLSTGLAIDSSGNLFVAERAGNRITRISPSNGQRTAVAGSSGPPEFGGDGGTATEATLAIPSGVALDSAGNIYIADTGNYRIRKVTPAGIITTVAGGGTPPQLPLPTDYNWGDGGLATDAILNYPRAVAVDGAGNIFIADSNKIRKVGTDGRIRTIANGPGKAGYSGDGGPALSATLNNPVAVAVDPSGNVYVADQTNNVIRVLRPSSTPVVITAVLDAAAETAIAVTPGKIVAVYGTGLGPTELALNAPSQNAFGKQVAGTRVTFNGIEAPMIYASDGQTAAIVPYGISGAATALVVVTSPSGASQSFSVAVAAAAPSLFSQNGTGAGQIAAVNLDGSLNDAAHPVKAGSYVSLYGTGEGQTSPAGVDGALAMTVYPKPVLPVSVTVDGIPVTPAYAGAAPTLVSGVMQIVVQIPEGVKPGGYVPVEVKVGDQSTVKGSAWIAVAGK